jgi:hypothetical protein
MTTTISPRPVGRCRRCDADLASLPEAARHHAACGGPIHLTAYRFDTREPIEVALPERKEPHGSLADHR